MVLCDNTDTDSASWSVKMRCDEHLTYNMKIIRFTPTVAIWVQL